MPDEDPRERFSGLGNLKDDYEDASTDSTEQSDSTESNDGTDETDTMAETTTTDSNDGIDVDESTDGNDGDDGNESMPVSDDASSPDRVKESRENVQAYIPAREKDNLENAFRKIKALCNLSDRDEPLKNDFYAAAFRHGYQDLEAIAEYLGLSEAYDEFGEMVD